MINDLYIKRLRSNKEFLDMKPIGKVICNKPLHIKADGTTHYLKDGEYEFEYVKTLNFQGVKYYITNTVIEPWSEIRILPQREIVEDIIY